MVRKNATLKGEKILVHYLTLVIPSIESTNTPPKTNMTMENQPCEEVFPIQNGGFSNVMLVFRDVIFIQFQKPRGKRHHVKKKHPKEGTFVLEGAIFSLKKTPFSKRTKNNHPVFHPSVSSR